MYTLDFEIYFKTEKDGFFLGSVESIEINADVDNLADTAKIVLPATVLNRVIELENKIKRGSEVTIKLGYDNDLNTEFVGYVQKITTDNKLIIHCEDALFLFRVAVPDTELKNVTVKQIAEYLVKNVDSSFTVNCDYGIKYEKFTIHKASAFDVLKKLQEETNGNIYFDQHQKILHIHPAYVEKGKDVYYSFHNNIENANLEYKTKEDKKVEVTIEKTNITGKIQKITVGSTGGEKIYKKVGAMDNEGLKKSAESLLVRAMSEGYEGTFDGWLIPFTQPTDSAHIEDLDYQYKNGSYYVKAVTTKFSKSGGVRTVKIGRRLT